MKTAEIIGNPFIIKNLEIAQFDFPTQMLWVDAIKSCESLGEFWRLPTIEEWAAILQSNRYLIGVHEKHELLPNVYPPPPRDYWSSTHNSESINYWSFSYGTQVSRNHTSKNFVRAVRSI
jgi:hypothetical protein